MNSPPATTQPAIDDDRTALVQVGSMVRACIQCGTCTGSCPNAAEMDLTPRKMWRLVILKRLDDVMASRTFILCSVCYICTLRCPRGLALTSAMETLKSIAFGRRDSRHRSSRLFYEKFMQTVRRYGRIREMAFMTRYLTALKSPTAPLRFAPLAIMLMRKGKVEMGWRKTAATPLDALFKKVEDMERTPDPFPEKEGHP